MFCPKCNKQIRSGFLCTNCGGRYVQRQGMVLPSGFFGAPPVCYECGDDRIVSPFEGEATHPSRPSIPAGNPSLYWHTTDSVGVNPNPTQSKKDALIAMMEAYTPKTAVGKFVWRNPLLLLIAPIVLALFLVTIIVTDFVVKPKVADVAASVASSELWYINKQESCKIDSISQRELLRYLSVGDSIQWYVYLNLESMNIPYSNTNVTITTPNKEKYICEFPGGILDSRIIYFSMADKLVQCYNEGNLVPGVYIVNWYYNKYINATTSFTVTGVDPTQEPKPTFIDRRSPAPRLEALDER